MKAYLPLAKAVRTLVSEDQLRDALDRLREAVVSLPDLERVILQEARFEALRKAVANAELDAERVGVEKNRIRKNLLELARELEHQGRAQTQVFISYSQRGMGYGLGKALHDHIESQGFVAFLDTEDIRVGEDWAEFILRSLKASDYFVLLLSEEANTSEMVIKEVLEARRLQSLYGKPIILPVRVCWPEGVGLNHQLADWLQRIQQVPWNSEADTTHVIQQLMAVISQRQTLRLTEAIEQDELTAFVEDLITPPIPSAPLEVPQGAVLLDSPFYIERKGEQNFIQRVTAPKALLRIRGPRQYGKTSLLSRVVAHAKKEGCEVVSMDFQNFEEVTLKQSDNLIWEFCWKIAYKLGLEEEFEDYWDKKIQRKPDRDKKQVAHAFIERQILGETDTNLLVAIDEADRIFPFTEVSDEFFLMLRSWHEGANTNEIWERFKLAISYSTEAKLAISNLNASPFNVGEEARLLPFTLDQVTQLVQSHGLSLAEEENTKLLDFLGGQPYLIRRALFSLANEEYTFPSLMEAAISDQGPFSDHLRHHLINVKQFPELAKALQTIIQTGKCRDPLQAGRLAATGLTLGTPPDDIHMACGLYAAYFKNKL